LKERVHSKEGINEHDPERRSSFRPSGGSFRRPGSTRSSNLDSMFAKNKPPTASRPSPPFANGNINQSANKTPNVTNLDETKRSNQQSRESSLTPSQYGKTLNVP
ncbi:unnamed protein product, partial [Adineta steineri]